MENTKWNKLTIRPLDDEEKEYYKNSKIDFMWDGKEPELDEEVLVYTNKSKGVLLVILSVLKIHMTQLFTGQVSQNHLKLRRNKEFI